MYDNLKKLVKSSRDPMTPERLVNIQQSTEQAKGIRERVLAQTPTTPKPQQTQQTRRAQRLINLLLSRMTPDAIAHK